MLEGAIRKATGAIRATRDFEWCKIVDSATLALLASLARCSDRPRDVIYPRCKSLYQLAPVAGHWATSKSPAISIEHRVVALHTPVDAAAQVTSTINAYYQHRVHLFPVPIEQSF